jgi:hypothetical protein
MAYQVVVLSSKAMSTTQCADLRQRMIDLAKTAPGALIHAPFVVSEPTGSLPEHRYAVRGLPLTLLPMKIPMSDTQRVGDLASGSAEVWAYPRYSPTARTTNVGTIVTSLRDRGYAHLYVVTF